MLALFLTLFHSEKLSLRSRALPPASLCVYAYLHVRDLYVSADLYVCAMRMRVCVCMCERRKNNGTELASNR